MLHLLKLEWLKLKDYILFKILIAAYIVFLPAILLLGKKIPPTPAGEIFDPQIMLFHFPSIWEFLAYIGNWLVFFILGFLAVLIITNEHSYRTMRQNIITGMQRSDWFWSKVIFIFTASVLASIYYALCAVTIGLVHAMGDSIYISTILKNSNFTIRYFLMSLGYMSFGMLVGLLVKRTGIALFVFIGYSFCLEPILRGLHLYFFRNETMHYFPLNVIEDLCPIPFADLAEDFTRENGFALFVNPNLAMALATGYILIFGWLSYEKLTKSDL
ncbi:MAG: ABC transporter permease [Saprospiraceae bacterium]